MKSGGERECDRSGRWGGGEKEPLLGEVNNLFPVITFSVA